MRFSVSIISTSCGMIVTFVKESATFYVLLINITSSEMPLLYASLTSSTPIIILRSVVDAFLIMTLDSVSLPVNIFLSLSVCLGFVEGDVGYR